LREDAEDFHKKAIEIIGRKRVGISSLNLDEQSQFPGGIVLAEDTKRADWIAKTKFGRTKPIFS
jgi:hypothetical protein